MSYHKNQQPGTIEIILFTIGKGLWFVISWPFKKLFKFDDKKVKFDKIKNLNRWQEIEKLIQSNDEIHAKHAVVEADNFFDGILRVKGGCGKSFAYRLRSLEKYFSAENYQFIWQAHKLRNQITHETEFHPSINECQDSIRKFKKGLINLGAI